MGPGFQGMAEQFDFLLFLTFVWKILMEIVNEHGWISVFLGEKETK